MNHEDAPRVSVIITAHAENPFWLRRAIDSVAKQIEAPDFELIVIADRPTPEVLAECARIPLSDGVTHVVDFGDLGEARNHGAKLARGKFVAFLDGDDLFGARWLRQAYEYARELEGQRQPPSTDMHHENFVLHPEYNIFFGAQYFMHRHIGDDDPLYDPRDMVQFNAWSALAFAPRSVFERFPYARAEHGHGYEDYHFNTQTLGAGVSHRVVPGSAHMIRMKADQSSMAMRYGDKHLAIPRMALFDRRDLPPTPASDGPEQRALPPEVVQQVLIASRDIGERQLRLSREMTIRQYPRQRVWNDQAWLRDAIGPARNVVVLDNLHRGGAEKYAIDFAKATGATIVETVPTNTGAAWREKAIAAGVKVVTWAKQADLGEEEQAMALQRALLQCELRSLLVCNSAMAWFLVHHNAEILAERVIAASFAVVPIGQGFESCPPFYMKKIPANFVLLTDNEEHAARLTEYNGAPVVVLRPKCDYDGPSKRSQITKKRLRVLWAGRGSPEKNPQILPAIAAVLEDKADIHVWGNVQPMNATENLKYRGPFDGFASIDGSYDVYLMTSLTEGMPNTAMEAVMADIPVVGPQIGGLPELVTMHYRGDPTAIAQAILHAPEKYTSAPKLRVEEWRAKFDEAAREIVNGETLRIYGAK